jgi:hypothetical protein
VLLVLALDHLLLRRVRWLRVRLDVTG